MRFRPVKGTRDFYPEAMRLRNHICDAWRRVSLRNGFEEYDAPIFEYLDLFTIKSGQEIAEQLFSFTDRGGRRLAIRPEITPSLARMVNAKINSLPRPIKWFSVPRICRAENPQKGRLREFFQWNIDIIGSDDVLADAECIFVLVDFLREVGLTPKDVQVRIGSRALIKAHLIAGGIPEERMDNLLVAQDKRLKLTQEDFEKVCAALGLSDKEMQVLNDLEDLAQSKELGRGPGLSTIGLKNEAVGKPLKDLSDLLEYLDEFGVGEYCQLDTRIVRGLAYYTGIVYEVYDAGQSLRAVAGGGRYDNLLEVLGGPPLGATGFGMGDVVLGILLEAKGKLPAPAGRLEFFVVDDGGASLEQVLEVVGALRSAGRSADFSYARRSIGKQLKEANRRGAARAVIVRPGALSVKDLTSGRQEDATLEELLAGP